MSATTRSMAPSRVLRGIRPSRWLAVGLAVALTIGLFAGMPIASAQPAPASNASPATDLAQALNALRALGCGGRPGVPDPLAVEPRLAQAARQLAGGAKLADALSQAGYRATRAHQIWLSGPRGVRAIADLAAANYCAALADPSLRAIGIHQQGNDTWMVLAAPFAPVAPAASADVAARVLELVNAARAQPRRCGNQAFGAAAPVAANTTLDAVALGHATDMARNNYFAHQGRDGSRPADRATRGGYRWRAIGENIAAGQSTPEAAVEGWIKSPPHCANLMGPQFAEMGIAFALDKSSDAGIYWVQMFGTR